MVCMFLIFSGVISYAWLVLAKEILFVQDRINTLTNQVEDLNVIKIGLTAELTRLSKEETVYVSSLSIMQQDTPTIEIFNSLDTSLIKGATLNSLSLAENELKLVGVAGTEDDIVETTRKLLETGNFSTAQVPVVTRTNMGPEGLKFTLSLIPLGFGGAK